MTQTKKNGWRQVGELVLALLLILLPLGYAASNIITSGVVGVNTANPDATLHINGSIKEIPIEPLVVGSLTKTNAELDYINPIDFANNYIYAGSWTNDSFSVIDVSDPTNPILVSSVSDSTNYNQIIGLDVVGKYAYTLSAASKVLAITDISDPSNPVIVGTTTDSLNNPRTVKVVGPYAFTSEANDEVNVFDISDPTNPVRISGVTDATNLDTLWPMDIQGDYAYVGSTDSDLLTIIDISDVEDMKVLGTIQDNQLNDTRGITVRGRYAYVAASIADRMTIVDVADPLNPTIVGSVYHGTYLNQPMSIQLLDKYAVVGAYLRLTIIDISDPTTPVIVASLGSLGLTLSNNLVIEGRYAYLANSNDDTLRIIDLQGFTSHAASIGDLEAGTLNVGTDVDVGNNLYVHSGMNVGPAGILSQGDVAVTGKARIAVPTMYLTNATQDGDHNCDDDPSACCVTNYHMCTVAEFLSGGRRIEDTGTDRDATVSGVDGFVDPGDDSTTIDCNGWNSNSASDEVFACNIAKATSCSVIANNCSVSFPTWCCSN